MSDLTEKFATLEEQLTTQHGEIMDALNTIAFALGAPPTIPSTNLADVVTAIGTSNGLLTDIFNTVDSINNNASLNAQRLLTLLLQTACPCDATVPMLPPPLLPTVTDLVGNAKCQRIQFFLDMYASWVISVVVYLDDNGSISSFQVDNALALTFGSISLDDGDIRPIPTGIRDSLTTLLNTSGSPSAINASIFDEITNGTVIADMRQALYAEDNALDGSPAAKAAALASGGPFASILAAAFYTNWANAIYGTEPVVDASGYDGTICAPEATCWTYNSSSITSNFGPATVVTNTSPHAGSTHSGYSPGQDFTGDYFGWTITPHDSNLYVLVAGLGNMNLTAPYTFGHTDGFFPNGVAAFEFELCQPEE